MLSALLMCRFSGCEWASVHVREFCSVHGWQNDTRCRDSLKVFWCHSHFAWLVFEGSIPMCACFCVLFLMLF